MQYGCIGEKLKHSFSKEIHNLLGDYGYEIREVAREELDSFMRTADFLGINVTIPYKEAVIPYLYCIDGSAKEIGAVNTIVKREGKLYGYNTDFYGMRSLIERMGLSLLGKKVAILGTGGTAKTAHAVSKSLEAAEILTVGRSAKNGVITYEELYEKHADIDILINTTPCGMYPYPDGNEDRAGAAVDVSRFTKLSGIVDAVYNPLRTNLVEDGLERGIPSEGGLYMLVFQAVRASEIFLDTEYEKEISERVYKKILAEKENIVLCGMPGSGKSTVGWLLAKRLGKPFADTDDIVTGKIGMPIADYFAARGEASFRDVECEAVYEVSNLGGQVISTGGGAILRDENIRALKKNGVLVFLDRPLSDLIPTPDRPIASSKEAIEKRYNERYGRYCEVSDVRIDINTNPDGVADLIIKELNER